VAAGLPCQAEPVASGAVHERVGGDVHQELVGAQEVHPEDGKRHVCSQERVLKRAVCEAKPPFLLPPAPDR